MLCKFRSIYQYLKSSVYLLFDYQSWNNIYIIHHSPTIYFFVHHVWFKVICLLVTCWRWVVKFIKCHTDNHKTSLHQRSVWFLQTPTLSRNWNLFTKKLKLALSNQIRKKKVQISKNQRSNDHLYDTIRLTKRVSTKLALIRFSPYSRRWRKRYRRKINKKRRRRRRVLSTNLDYIVTYSSPKGYGSFTMSPHLNLHDLLKTTVRTKCKRESELLGDSLPLLVWHATLNLKIFSLNREFEIIEVYLNT